jgi:hypothetical protein
VEAGQGTALGTNPTDRESRRHTCVIEHCRHQRVLNVTVTGTDGGSTIEEHH